ncbi:MAG TPA: zinc dependent phospholipase C family protein [Chitinophagaceae bacterium]|nr:zinc dependent phospholipase C family protein [Chitinophagaceae bacterium]
MRTKIITSLFFVLFIFSGIGDLFGWGEWGHKHINRAAVFALPAEMRKFYYNHIDFITEGAVVPDLRRALINDRNEPPRHYIDIENYNLPIAELPKTPEEAYRKYDSQFLNQNGLLPWYIQTMMDKLTRAFERRDKSEILFLSTDLAHYVGDAHMPLHTASNYNGQFTGQKGVHALWESEIPEMFGNSYNFKTGDAQYIANIPDYTWKMIAQSHSLEDTLLSDDMSVRKKFNKTDLYKKDASGNLVLSYGQPVYSDEYARRFNDSMYGMVEQQLRLSIQDVANYWYTAWVNAGKPDLLSLDDPHLTYQNRKNYKKEYKAWSKGKLLNLAREKESD